MLFNVYIHLNYVFKGKGKGRFAHKGKGSGFMGTKLYGQKQWQGLGKEAQSVWARWSMHEVSWLWQRRASEQRWRLPQPTTHGGES